MTLGLILVGEKDRRGTHRDINHLHISAEKRQVAFNASKSVVMHFGRLNV